MNALPMIGRRITLSDVAKKAGVHITTVSLAMRNNPRLPGVTRQRIRTLAEEMGYRPDPRLQAMMAYRAGLIQRRHRPTLAYLTNGNTEWGWKQVTAPAEFFNGAEARAAQLGYKLEHFWLRGAGISQERLGQILYFRGIKGLIIASLGRETAGDLPLQWGNFSTVQIGGCSHSPALHNVTNNPGQAIRLAMQRVTAAGYRRVGFIMHRAWDQAADHHWTAGFLGEQQRLRRMDRIPALLFPKAPPAEGWLSEPNAATEVDPQLLAAWLRRHQPEVLLTRAAGVQAALDRLGLRVPQDLARVDLSLGATDGTVAGVRPHHEAIGALAVERLAGQLHRSEFGAPAIATTMRVNGTWSHGASCPMPRIVEIACGFTGSRDSIPA